MTIRMKRIVEFRNSVRGHVFDTYLVPFFKDHGCLFDSRDIIGIVEQVNNYVDSLPVTSVDKAILNVRYPVIHMLILHLYQANAPEAACAYAGVPYTGA